MCALFALVHAAWCFWDSPLIYRVLFLYHLETWVRQTSTLCPLLSRSKFRPPSSSTLTFWGVHGAEESCSFRTCGPAMLWVPGTLEFPSPLPEPVWASCPGLPARGRNFGWCAHRLYMSSVAESGLGREWWAGAGSHGRPRSFCYSLSSNFEGSENSNPSLAFLVVMEGCLSR